MKRVFAFALLAGIVAVPASAAWAQAGPAQSAPGVAQQAPGQNILGDQAPQQNIVQDGQPRGELGGLASGAPGVANVTPAPAAGAAPAQAVVGQTTQVTGQTAVAGQTAVTTQSAVVASQSTTGTPGLDIHQQHFNMMRIMHHCMNRTIHDRLMAGQPPVARMGFAAPFPFFAPPPGDLEIVGVGMLADATPEKGPIYRVSFRNNSKFVARNFQISLVAVLGKLSFDSPVITVEVPEVAAAAVGTMDIQFPITVMSMGPKDQLGPFESLIAAIDSFNELPEINELNNISTLTRTDITIVETAEVTATTATATTTTTTATAVAPAGGAAPVAPAGVAPAPAGGAPAPAAGAPVAPAEGAAPQPENVPAPAPSTPMDNSLDNIPLDNVEGTSALFTK
jgi:hypothetical protein